MTTPLRIAHLYPDLLNLYADKGNIQTLSKRCLWRGIPIELISVPSGERPDFRDYHLVLLGGGSDREQVLVGQTLLSMRDEMHDAIESGLPVLAVCGGYQLLGEYYQLPDGTKVPGLSLVQLITEAHPEGSRLIGNIAIESKKCGLIVGFENHGGRTTHEHEPLGMVRRGHGNNGVDGKEGIRYKNIFGTYIHGPLLPKNPRLADALLKAALEYADLSDIYEFTELEDTLELSARAAFGERRLEMSGAEF